MLEPDEVNLQNKLSYAEYLETQALKNKILAMSNSQKKQLKWNNYFGEKLETDDSYLMGNVY